MADTTLDEEQIRAVLSRSTPEAAAELGVDASTVNRWRRSRGIPSPPRPTRYKKAGGGEPRETFSIRLEPALLAALRDEAAQRGITLTALVEEKLTAKPVG